MGARCACEFALTARAYSAQRVRKVARLEIDFLSPHCTSLESSLVGVASRGSVLRLFVCCMQDYLPPRGTFRLRPSMRWVTRNRLLASHADIWVAETATCHVLCATTANGEGHRKESLIWC